MIAGEPVIGPSTALIVVDVQVGMDDPRLGRRINPGAEARMAQLLASWRVAGMPIVHIQHRSTEPDSPLRPELPGNAIKSEVMPEPGEPVVEKSVNSAFIGTDLEERLRSAGVGSVVIIGLTTDHCVSATARMASDLGFATTVVSDATATFDRVGPDGTLHSAETVHELSLVALHQEFARITTTKAILEALSERLSGGPTTDVR